MMDEVKLTAPVSRSYGEYCGVARALDLVGDRWSFLIVRELLIRPSRYGELLQGLPGIATNLLAKRLRTLEAAGIIERSVATSANSVVYELSAWGLELREPVEALIRWATPLMVTGPGDDVFQTHWLVVALSSLLHDRRSRVPLALSVESAGERLTITLDADHMSVRLGSDDRVVALLQAEPRLLLALAVGNLGVDDAIAAGAIVGDRGAVDAIFSASEATLV